MSAEDTRKSFNSRRPGDRCEPGDTEVERSFWRARVKCLYLLRNHTPVGRVGLQPGRKQIGGEEGKWVLETTPVEGASNERNVGGKIQE